MNPALRRAHARDGWPLLWALATAQIVSWGAMYYSFSLFVVPMEAELGWSRAQINGALTLGLLTAGFAAYPVGAWIDRRGGRWLMTLGSALGTLLLAAWAFVESLFALYAIWVGLGLVLAATLYEPVFAVVTRIFPESYRRRITALTLVGGFASTVFIPLTQVFISALGWRDALIALAACNLLIALPVHALLLRDEAHGGSHAAPKSGSQSPGEHDALRRALTHPAFWGLAVCFTAYYTAFSAVSFHIIPLLTDRGVPIATIVAAVAIVGPAQVVARLILFAARERLTTAFAGLAATILFPLSVLLLIAFPASIAALFAFAACYGAANGTVTIVRGTVVPDFMWREGYGAINGALTLPTNIARALAPFAAALIWSASGRYDAVLWSVFGAGCAAALAFGYAAAVRRGRRG
ncbi:MAG TPA: MFS transporter [Burkholderiales bacterium]|nr:MFS transporter [Burkholderiales bacterium]